MGFRSYDAERGPDLSGVVTDGRGDAADAQDVLLVVKGKAGGPDSSQFPVEGGGGSNGIGGHALEDRAMDDAVEFLLRQPSGESLAHGGTVNRPSGPDLLDDPYGAFGLALRYDRHDTVPEDRKAGPFARAATQLVKERHGDLGQLLLAPGMSREAEELGSEGVGPGVAILNEITEFNERAKEMMSGTPGQGGLAGDLGKRRRAPDAGDDLDDPKPPFQGLVGLVQVPEVIHMFHRMKQARKKYLTE